MGSRAPRPFAITGAVAVASTVLLAAALALGWLGPDVGRGSSFCEAARDAIIKQPANTLSNLGFVIAGLAAAAYATRHGTGTMNARLAAAYTVLLVLLGPGSAAMHASQSALGGHLDLSSMYLFASFVMTYAASRLFRLSTAGFVGVFVAALGVCTIAEFVSTDVPVVNTAGNAVFAALLLAGVVMEVVLARRDGELDVRWGVAAVGTLLVAFAIWNTGMDGGPLCEPHSLLQPHAAWHLLDALAAGLLFRYYVSGKRTWG